MADHSSTAAEVDDLTAYAISLLDRDESESSTDDEEADEGLALAPASPFLTVLTPALRMRILASVLLPFTGGIPRVQLRYLTFLPNLFSICKQFFRDCRYIWSQHTLHIEEPLEPGLGRMSKRTRNGIRAIFGQHVQNVSVRARVVYVADWPRLEIYGPSKLPGLHDGTQLLTILTVNNVAHGVQTMSARLLQKKFGPTNIPGGINPIPSFAPISHGNLFGWIRYADVTVGCLTVYVQGHRVWEVQQFHENIMYWKGLPLISLIASIIAFMPKGVAMIRLVGLGTFCEVVRPMWANIPNRTPLKGHSTLLDMLCDYPFPEFFPGIREVYMEANGQMGSRAREGNLFGLMSSTQWQVFIMKARHGKNQPKWEFHP
ncbi:hypothetical protein P154DRAFT_343366 [Amniculicola lignicola CBS 123094]|uniref:Uncharacterized protein n=1 Tax=Amniculicola lignicola CBS 123094 TaxID=1392246 RepID=A0A6A5W2X2_9PLEO|nr:hypothetical protein P154DRAFT_343366 [Amniculicola lignicola CBS 123094]